VPIRGGCGWGGAERAARCVFWLAFGLLSRGERARSGGWLTRAQRLLDDAQLDCVEQGYLLGLGEIAEGMYPFGSNGASQAVLDARSVASLLARTTDVAAALRAYEASRLPTTTRIVNDTRRGGPERVIDLVEDRAPGGFIDLDRVASHAELEAIVKGYARTAGSDQDQVNR
jgi:2-polyprenyl-6-methoxyphenol hydroxylase-like FAD-dependent oxidoreductase